MSTRSSLAVFNADEVVEIEKTCWASQDTLHHVGMGRPGQRCNALEEIYGQGNPPETDGIYTRPPSMEARVLLDQHDWIEDELGRDTVLPLED